MNILERIAQLKDDPSMPDKGRRFFSELAFRQTTEALTGDDLAIALASLIAYGEQAIAQSGVSVERTGNVFTAAISDSVRAQDALGG